MSRCCRPRLLALVTAVALAAGCHAPAEPAAERAASLLGARVPGAVAPGAAFALVAYFGRGACDVSRPVIALGEEGAAVGMQLRPADLPPGSSCPDVLLRDSVLVRVTPPFRLPYTVRLRRGPMPDSVLLVRAITPAG